MKSLLRIFGLTALLFIVNWMYPAWWWILFLPILFMFIFSKKPIIGFMNGFISGFICWGGVLTFEYLKGSDLIANRISMMFGLNNGLLLVLIITILGGLFASIGGGTGASLRSLFYKKKKYIYY